MSLNTAQKALLRSESQYSILGLAILQPRTILACQITDYTGTDMITEVGYGNVTSGTYTDVLPGMIVFLGSSPGLYDIGVCRVRKAWTADTAYFGEESSIAFADGVYMTVVDAMDVRPRHLTVVSESEVYMDADIAYSDQHENFDPVVRMGGQVVVDVESYPVVVNFPAVADSSVFDSTISSYSFVATEGSVGNGTTNNPSLTISSYPTNGYIRVAETITAANGKSFTGYRYVFVFDATHRPITDFVLGDCGCDRDSGGWSATVTLNNSSDIDLVRIGGLAVLFAKDYFNGEQDVVGLYAGRENILMSGWIYKRTSANDPEFQPNEFEIQSAAFWLSHMSSYPMGVEISTSVATAWTNMQNLTIDRGLFHLLHWRTTVTQIMDVYFTDDARYSAAVESSAVNVWDQIVDIAQSQILAEPACNYNCMLAIKVPYNLIPSADRAAASSLVMDLVAGDYARNVEITKEPLSIAQVVLSGVAVDEYGNGEALFSLSPGHVPALLGGLLPMPNLLLESQEQSNILAGLVFASENNPYKNIPLTLVGNNRAFDIAPVLHGTITDLDEYVGVIVPNAVSYSVEQGENGLSGKLTVEIDFEGETDEADAIYINGDIPDGEGGFVNIGGLGKLPPIKPIDLPEIPPTTFPPTIPTVVTSDCGAGQKNFFALAWSKPYLDGTKVDKLVSRANFPCKVRNDSIMQTYIDFSCKFHGDASSNIHVYGTLGGTRILNGRLAAGIGLYAFRAYFDVLSPTEVDGFEIEIDAGPGNPYTFGDVLGSGAIDVNDTDGVLVPDLVEGNYYAIQGNNGPYYDLILLVNSWTLDVSNNGGSSFSARVGYDGATFHLTKGFGISAEAVDSHYGRLYFQVGVGAVVHARVADTTFNPNGGSFGYILRSVSGRALEIFGATLNNVCAP